MGLDRRLHTAIVMLPVNVRVIDIQLDLVTVRVSQVDALTDGVIRELIY